MRSIGQWLDLQDPARLAPVPGTIERVLEIVDHRFGGSGAVA